MSCQNWILWRILRGVIETRDNFFKSFFSTLSLYLPIYIHSNIIKRYFLYVRVNLQKLILLEIFFHHYNTTLSLSDVGKRGEDADNS